MSLRRNDLVVYYVYWSRVNRLLPDSFVEIYTLHGDIHRVHKHSLTKVDNSKFPHPIKGGGKHNHFPSLRKLKQSVASYQQVDSYPAWARIRKSFPSSYDFERSSDFYIKIADIYALILNEGTDIKKTFSFHGKMIKLKKKYCYTRYHEGMGLCSIQFWNSHAPLRLCGQTWSLDIYLYKDQGIKIVSGSKQDVINDINLLSLGL